MVDPPAGRTVGRRRNVVLAGKVLLASLLCAALIWRSDWHALAAILRGADRFLLVAVFACMVLNVTISAAKWHLLLSIHGAPCPFRRLHRLYFSASFFNNFLPTGIGGDAYRILKTIDGRRSKAVAVIAVLMERVTGIVALIILGIAGSLVSFSRSGNEFSRLVLIVGVGLLAVAAGAWTVRSTLVSRLSGGSRKRELLRALMASLQDYPAQRAKTLLVIVISFGYHAFSVFRLSLLFTALGSPLPASELLVVAALAALASLIPVSVNGLGVQDGAFVYVLGRYGVDYNIALLAAGLIRFFVIPISVVGGFLYVLGERPLAALGEERSTEQESM